LQNLLCRQHKIQFGRHVFLQVTCHLSACNQYISIASLQPGESREAKPDMVYLDATGHQRYTKGVDEKLVARQRRGAAPGKAMYIEGGRHSGFFCTVRPDCGI